MLSSSSTLSAAEKQRAREHMTGLIPQLYQRLNADSDMNTGIVLSTLEDCAWIWIGDTFVNVSNVALTSSVNASPYLYQLPQDLQVYGKLLALFKVKQAFTSKDYVEVLRRMAVDTRATSKDSFASVVPLSDHNIDVAVSLATLLTTETSLTWSLQSQEVYIPDSNGKLALSVELINDDVPWLSGLEYVSMRRGCRFVHPNLSSKVAESLGVKSMRLTLLNKNVEQNLFSVPVGSVESFGQAESLTNRLKTILDMYPDGNPIFSELIQNADDAGATEVKIMLDENEYASESLLDTKMSRLQVNSISL
jgi:sacsin